MHIHGESEAAKRPMKNRIMGRKHIYDQDFGYSCLKPVVDWNMKHSYRKTEVVGYENIPEDGAVFFAPNHCNTLMDALVMLRANKGTTVFGARADLFNNPFIGKLMTFIRILPMVRQRDGLRNVLKNLETQETIVDTLENKVGFCIFPEGRHRPEKSLLPLGKGVFRAALAANARFGNRMPVYIVPVGIEYGDFFRYRSTSLVKYGMPINVTEHVRNSQTDNEAQIIDSMRKDLTQRMSDLFTYIKDGDNLREKWMLTKMLAIADGGKGYGDFGSSLHDGMLRNREIIAGIGTACEEHPDEMNELLEKVAQFDKYRRKDAISIYSFRKDNTILNNIGKGVAALIGLPYFIFSAIVSLPLWLTYFLLKKNIKDRAFHNTVGFGVKLAGGIIFGLIYLILAFCLAPWWMALILFALTIPSYGYFFDYIEGCRRWFSDIKVHRCKKLRKSYRKITEEYSNLK